MKKIEIKSIFGKVLFTYKAENATIKDAVENAIKEKVSLRNSNLSYSNLSGSDLSGSNLRGSNLSGSDLRYSNLSASNLSGSDLRYSNLSASNLSGSDLRYSNLSYSDLSGSDLRGSNLSGSDLSSSNLSGSENKHLAYLPLFCKWNFSIIGDKIQIGCKTKNIEDWDVFFQSSEEYSTKRNTQEFKQIQAVYNACKAYLLTLND